MVITKQILVDELVDTLGISRKIGQSLVESCFATIRATLASGEAVHLSGFGNFNLRDKPPRPGRNPKTGIPCTITARRVVTFTARNKQREYCQAKAHAHPAER